jgi:hypothetical protein
MRDWILLEVWSQRVGGSRGMIEWSCVAVKAFSYSVVVTCLTGARSREWWMLSSLSLLALAVIHSGQVG